jgi:uncharacterized membrane protein
MGAEEDFERVLLTGKISIIVGLLALCFVNGDSTYVSKNPKKFVGDCVVSGLSGAIAFIIIAMMRKKTYLLPGLAISSFLLLFVFNVLCEFSGFNSNFKNTEKEKKEFNFAKIPALVCLCVGLGLLFYFANKAKVQLEGSNLLSEALVFGILSGLAQGYITASHGHSAFESVGTGMVMTILFGMLHVAMQKGGFYDNMVFSNAPPCIK